MARRASARRAMSLLELTAVVLIIGVVAGMAVMRFGSDTIADVGAQGTGRRLALGRGEVRCPSDFDRSAVGRFAAWPQPLDCFAGLAPPGAIARF